MGTVPPPGLAIDSGGLGKGLFADVVADQLAAITRLRGRLRRGPASRRHAARARLSVASPFDGACSTVRARRGGVATSGIGRRSWLDASGAPAHHLLDPGSGRPAFTGIVQATALAPTALEAETLAKAALLSGPSRAREWLGHGGVLVFEDGGHEVLEPDPKD